MGVAADQYGNVFIADRNNQIIRRVDTGSYIRLVAGTSADCRDAHVRLETTTVASLPAPSCTNHQASPWHRMAGYFIADTLSNQVEVVKSDGHIWRLLGGLNQPRGLAFDDGDGTLYVADQYNCQIIGYNPAFDDPNNPFDGPTKVIAGNGSCAFGAYGDGGQATSAKLDFPGASRCRERARSTSPTPSNNRVRS